VGMKEILSLVIKIVLLILAALAIIFGFFWDTVNSQSQVIEFDSVGKGMPEDGFFTPMYDPWTTVHVTVDADQEVEVQLYASHYRGGKLSKDANNDTVYRDEWLAAGQESERTGRSVALKDFSRTSAYYWVKVLQPGTSIPSETDYTINIKAKTIDMGLIESGLILYALFIMWGVLETVNGIFGMLKSGVPTRGEEAEGAGLEALLEPTAQAPAPAPAATSYESLYGAPPPRGAPAPAPRMAPEPPVYQPPPPAAPVYQPQPAPPAPRAYQPPPPAAPAYQAPPAPPAYQPPPMAAPAAPPAREPVSKVRCPACKSIVPIYTTERPTPIECPVCGKKGMIR
jgi:hypothetical protein